MEDISKDIVSRAARGDIGAFEDIYRKASGFVYNVAFRVTSNDADADEVTQDVFIKIHRNLARFRFLSSFKTWIYRVTVNAAINYRKREEKHINRRANYDLAIQTARVEESARSEAGKADEKEKVSAILSILNPDQRACLVLREIEGLDYREIASALKININTVRSRLKRARQKLMSVAEKG